MTKVRFKRWDCVMEFGQYSNSRVAIKLIDANNGEPVAVATINLPDEPLGKDEIFIKDYSENTGMVNALYNAGVISNPIGYSYSSFVIIPKCKLLIEPNKREM